MNAELEVTVTASVEELAARFRPNDVPESATFVRAEAIEGGTQRDPFLKAVKLVWRWRA